VRVTVGTVLYQARVQNFYQKLNCLKRNKNQLDPENQTQVVNDRQISAGLTED
jgi:hypothetical protein